MKEVSLASVLTNLESGSRPKGGVTKDSGEIPSLGGEHINNQGGFNLKKLKLIPQDFYDKLNSGKIKQKDILVVKDGATTGKTSFVRESFPLQNAAINEHVFRLEVNQEIAEPSYVFHFLFSDVGQSHILKDFRGATVGGISRNFTNKVKFPLPPLPEQKRIAEVLDKADALREKRRLALQKLDTLLQSVFLEMFGDPFHSNSNESNVFSDLVDRITYGFTCPMKHLEDGIPIITAKNVRDGYIDFDNVHFASKDEYDDLTSKSKPKNGDILITKDGTIGRCAIVDVDFPFCINQSVSLVELDHSKVSAEYLLGYLMTYTIQQKLNEMGKGNAIKHLKITELAKFPINIPSTAKQNTYKKVREHILQMININQISLNKFENLFQSLQQKAFKGELFEKEGREEIEEASAG